MIYYYLFDNIFFGGHKNLLVGSVVQDSRTADPDPKEISSYPVYCVFEFVGIRNYILYLSTVICAD
jgi:hypothetical protein